MFELDAVSPNKFKGCPFSYRTMFHILFSVLCDIDVQQRCFGPSRWPAFPIFWDFCQAGCQIVIHPVCMISLRACFLILAHFNDILNLADVADVFVANSIPQTVVSDAPSVLSRCSLISPLVSIGHCRSHTRSQFYISLSGSSSHTRFRRLHRGGKNKAIEHSNQDISNAAAKCAASINFVARYRISD